MNMALGCLNCTMRGESWLISNKSLWCFFWISAVVWLFIFRWSFILLTGQMEIWLIYKGPLRNSDKKVGSGLSRHEKPTWVRRAPCFAREKRLCWWRPLGEEQLQGASWPSVAHLQLWDRADGVPSLQADSFIATPWDGPHRFSDSFRWQSIWTAWSFCKRLWHIDSLSFIYKEGINFPAKNIAAFSVGSYHNSKILQSEVKIRLNMK